MSRCQRRTRRGGPVARGGATRWQPEPARFGERSLRLFQHCCATPRSLVAGFFSGTPVGGTHGDSWKKSVAVRNRITRPTRDSDLAITQAELSAINECPDVVLAEQTTADAVSFVANCRQQSRSRPSA